MKNKIDFQRLRINMNYKIRNNLERSMHYQAIYKMWDCIHPIHCKIHQKLYGPIVNKILRKINHE